jgi:hypothetical protein
MDGQSFVAALDIGAGSGAKTGLFGPGRRLLAEGTLHRDRYGPTAESMADALASAIRALALQAARPAAGLLAAGVACPGTLMSDGRLSNCINIPSLVGRNLSQLLSERLSLPVACINDADAGGTAVWDVERRELLYWVLGGGWGGAWLSASGDVLHPSIDWDGDDASLHFTNEPGYAIPLEKTVLQRLFDETGVSFDRWTEICVAELMPPNDTLTGPSGRADCVRAELLISGTGRWRIFRAVTDQDSSCLSLLSPDEADQVQNPSTAGKVLDRLSALRAGPALKMDALFGRVLAEAAAVLFDEARRDGCPPQVPIFLGGKPSRALPYFGPFAEEAMRRKGILTPLRLASLEVEGKNANLLGAAVLAERLTAEPAMAAHR